MNTASLNPVELEIARNRLESISEEVGTTLIQTSYSPNIKDRRDCSSGIYMPDGELISQAEHIPLHLGLMPTLIGRALDEYGHDNIRPGDVLMTNNPYLGGSHLPDMCVISPIFIDGEIVAVVANMAHHVDVGGVRRPGADLHRQAPAQRRILARGDHRRGRPAARPHLVHPPRRRPPGGPAARGARRR